MNESRETNCGSLTMINIVHCEMKVANPNGNKTIDEANKL